MAKEQAKIPEPQEAQQSGNDRSVVRRDSSQQESRSLASPVTLMRRFIEDLDRLFEDFGSGPRFGLLRAGSRGDATWMPPLEIVERDGQIVIRTDVPGVSKEQIKIEVQDGTLAISGERSQEREERSEGFYQSERSYGRFYRTVPLPEGADPGQAKATFSNGVLEISFPAPKRREPVRIEVGEGQEGKQSQAA